MKNKIQYIISALAFIVSYTANAQVTSQKIGNNPTIISPNAVLEMESATKGVLFPRVTLSSITDVTTVLAPTDGLTVFNTATAGTSPNNVSFGYYYWSATASKWVKLAVETPPIEFAKTVYVNSMSPSTATIFDETNPAATNNNTLKAAVANLYIGNDGSTWTYDNANSTYKTYAVAPSTPFYLANTTNDAGNNKTGSIWRTGNIGIGINNPATNLHIHNALGATTTVNADAKVLRLSRPTLSGLKWDNIAQFNLGSYSTAIAANTRLDLALTNGGNAVDFTNVMTWQANGNVGIGTTAPEHLLHVRSAGNSTVYLETTNSSSGQTSIDFKTGTAQSWRLVGQGSANASRFDIWNQTLNTNVLSILPNNNIGIGTVNPTSRLEVNGSSTNTTSFNAGNSATIDFSKSNLAYTGASPGAFTLTNIKDGGTYTLSVRGENRTGAASTFSVPSGFSVKGPNHNSPTTTYSETLYTFLVIGTYVYVYMATGI